MVLHRLLGHHIVKMLVSASQMRSAASYSLHNKNLNPSAHRLWEPVWLQLWYRLSEPAVLPEG